MWASATVSSSAFTIHKGVVIPTHMWASATKLIRFEAYKQSVVIPTHMWASATGFTGVQYDRLLVVIPTHMWASATKTCRVFRTVPVSCYTHSYVGFCNLLRKSGILRTSAMLLYPLICGLLQLTD